MAAQTWTTLQTTLLAALAQAPPPYNVIPPDFAQLFPQATSYAEGRIYKDLVLLATRSQSTSLTTTAGSRTLNLSVTSPQIIVPEGLALVVGGVQRPYDEASLDVIDLIWPNQSQTLSPDAANWLGRYWALLDDHTMVMAPTPDASYPVIIPGLYQPTPISAGNPTTYLSTFYPELLESACMVWLSGALLRNWSATSDDPKMALSHEAQYQSLVAISRGEEMRRRGLTPDAPSGRPG